VLQSRKSTGEIGIGSGDAKNLRPQPCLLRRKRVRLNEAIRDTAVGKKRDPRQVRVHRPQQGDMHPRLIGIVGRNPGHVSERPSRWAGQTVADRIDDNRINNGNVLRGLSRRAGRHCTDRGDQVDGSPNQFAGEAEQPLRITIRDTELITDGLPLDEAAVAHPGLEILDRARRAGRHDTDGWHLIVQGRDLPASARALSIGLDAGLADDLCPSRTLPAEQVR